MREPGGGPARHTSMRTLRGLLSVLAAAAGLVVAAPGAAYACSCVDDRAGTAVRSADAVVWAEVDEVQMPAMGGGTASYLLSVERVYKGEVTERAQVDSEASGASCGLEGIEVDRRYVFFLDGDGPRWYAGLCGGTGQVSRARVERVLAGAEDGAGVDRTSDDPGRDPLPGGPTRLPVSPASYAGMVLGGAAAVVTGVVMWRRRGGSGPARGDVESR